MANKEQEKFISDVKSRFPLLTFRHRHLISRELNKLSSCQNDKAIELQLSISEKLEEYLEFFKERENHIPELTYDDNLPVSQKREEIIEAIKANQVVIIAGETGSGKTTQIPKMCLEAGLGRFGFIGHTQPRRIAARAVSTRIASELGEELALSALQAKHAAAKHWSQRQCRCG